MNFDWTLLWEVKVGGFTFGELVSSFLIVLLTLFLRKVVTWLLFKNLRSLADRTSWTHDNDFLDALEKPVSQFLLIFGIYFAAIILPMDPEWAVLLTKAFRALSILILFWGLMRIADVLVDMLGTMSAKRNVAGDTLRGFTPLIKKSLRVFIILVGAVMVIDNLGYNVGGIIATLGLGGAAFAFAAKDTIANIYGSIALALDRPFKVGDWVQVGSEVDGTVEEIGLRSTKVRTFPKTVISIPNAVLANEMINNYSRMPIRRVKQTIGVTYATGPKTVQAIVADIKESLVQDEDVDQNFMLVHWTDFGDSALEIMVYYFTKPTQWADYLAIRERINVRIAEIVESHGSSVAFPTRTVFLEGGKVEG